MQGTYKLLQMGLYSLLGIYIIFIIGLSYYFSKGATEEDYLISGRDRNTWHILASKFAGAIGVSTFITYTAYTYRFGAMGVLALLLGILVGYNLFAFWAAPKVKQLSLQGKFYTQGDLVQFCTNNPQTALFTNAVTIIIQFFWVLLALVGGAKTIAYFGILSYSSALLATAAVILVYVLLSGFKAVIITDVVQTFIILIFLVLIVYSLFTQNETAFSTLLQAQPNEKLKLGSVIGLLLYGALSVFGLADRYQLCYAAKDVRSLKRGMSLAVLPIILLAALLMGIGLIALTTNPNLDYDNAFIHVMQTMLDNSLQPLLLVLFFAGLMSSADTNIFAVASHLSLNNRDNNSIRNTQISIAVVVVLASLIAFFWTSIIDITIVGAALRLTIAVPMIYILRGGQNSSRFISSTILGFIALGAGILITGAKPTLALFVLLGTLLGLLNKGKKDFFKAKGT